MPISAPKTDPNSSQLSSSPPSSPQPSTDIATGISNQIAYTSTQIMSILRHMPAVFSSKDQQGNLKEDAAQTLSNLAQQPAPFQASQHQLPGQQHPYHHAMNDPGPSSHPRGPPNLGQSLPIIPMHGSSQEMEEGSDGEDGANSASGGAGPSNANGGTPNTGSKPRANRAATMGSDEWSRQRKDNHKEVERRRRGNINEGINELGRIVPNGSGEKAKGAILSRAVQYIHHLKENEARNIEKWTLEKLLMDQAMGDLQAQLEEIKRMWEEERMAKTRLEAELEALKGASAKGDSPSESKSGASKRRSEPAEEEEDEREGKKQRVD